MKTETSPIERRKFYQLHQEGQTYEEISALYSVSAMCVRYWCRKQAKGEGVENHYDNPRAGTLSQFDAQVGKAILDLREAHPKWGPESIHLHLGKDPSLQELSLPSRASIGRFLHSFPEFRHTRKKKESVERPHAVSGVHQRWQMDWKVKLQVGEGQSAQLSTVRDPYAATFVGLDLYETPSPMARVQEANVRATLRDGFERVGLPDEIQTDGEPVLNSTAHDGFPSDFQLWLVGLGIRHNRIRPGVPTDDAEVERGHRTVMDYAVIGQENHSLEQLRLELAQAREELNTEYPSRAHGCEGRPPVQAHPDWLQPKRRYTRATEADLFDLKRVDAFLAGMRWERKVGKAGQITLGGAHQTYFVGGAYRGQLVQVHFDTSDRCFVASLPKDKHSHENSEVKRWPAKLPSADEIMNLPKEVIVNEHS